MREILFRGKRVDNGEWVYGYYVPYVYEAQGGDFTRDRTGHFILPKKGDDEQREDDIFEMVDPKTVGQFTGLLDRNGKRIWEGDVIVQRQSDRPYSEKRKYCDVIMLVSWNSGVNVCDNDFNNEALAKDPSCFNMQPCFWGKVIYNEKGYGCCTWSEFSRCEVIGNIHDNPEILTQTFNQPSEQ